MRYASALTTFAAVSRQLAKADPSTTPDAQAEYDDYFAHLDDLIYASGAWLSQKTSRTFVPERYSETVYFQDLIRKRKPAHYLKLNADVLELHSVSWDGVAVAASNYRMSDGLLQTSRNLLIDSSASLTVNSSDFNAGIVIDATWCSHTFIPDAYTTIDTSVTLANSTVTTINVTSGAAYEALQYIKCENELMHILSIASNVLTVKRGMNGTTAAVHSGQPLQRFNVQFDVALAATRLVAFLYERRVSVGSVMQVLDGSVSTGGLPDEANQIIQHYQQHINEVT